MLLSPKLSSMQTFTSHRVIPRNQLDLEILGDSNQGCLELVVLHVIGIGGIGHTCHNLVGGDEPKQCGIEQS